MGWEDSDDDDDWDCDVDAMLAAKKANEEELTIDDIEEAERKKAEAEAAAAPKPKKKVKKKEDEEKDPEDVPYDVVLEDPVAEKMRRQKLVEEADARMAADLFAGVEKAPDEIAKEKAAAEAKAAKEAAAAQKKVAAKAKIEVRDAFDELKLSTQADVEELLAKCLEKLENGKAKTAAPLFLTQLTKALEAQLTTEELNNFDKMIAGMVKDKRVEKTAADTAKRKTNEKMSKTTKFDTGKEMADVYGEGDWDDWDEEEWWDEGTAATAAEYAAPKR